MVQWFGRSWGAGICTPAQHADTPVGEKCMYCGKPIGDFDQGFLIPHPGEPPELWRYRPWHLDCFTESIGVTP